MNFILALAAIGSTVLRARAECVSFAAAAKDAGATGLLSALENAAKSDAGLMELSDLLNTDSEVDPDDQITVFAPTDAAFKEVSLLTLDHEAVADVLLNHFVEGSMDSEQLLKAAKSGEMLRSESAGDLTVSRGLAGDLYISAVGTGVRAQVTTREVETCAGVMHIVDAVLVPAAEDIDSEEDAAVSVGAVGIAQAEQSREIQSGRRALLTGSRGRLWKKVCRKGKWGKRVCRKIRTRQTSPPPTPPPVGKYGRK